MWELEQEEGWVLKNQCFWTVVLERLLSVPWTARRSNQSVLKEINSEYHWKDWYWIEAPILLPPDVKNWLIGKDSNAGKDWRWEEKGMTEDEMVGWNPWFNGHEFEQTPGDSEEQGIQVCCSPGVTKSRTRLWDWITTRRGFQLEEVLLLSKFAKNL